MTYDDSFFERDAAAGAKVAERLRADLRNAFDTFRDVGRAVLFLGSIHDGPGSTRYEAARLVSRRLAESGYSIITAASSGGGIMEAANRGCLEGGGRSIGCTVAGSTPTVVDEYVGLHVDFEYYVTRRTVFMKYADGFVLMPGGVGTADQLLEALALIQKGKVRSFPVVLFGTEYWSGLMEWLRGALVAGREMTDADLAMVTLTDDPEEAIALFAGGSIEA